MTDMFDLWKKSMLFGLGVLAFTVEKTGEIIDDFVKRGDTVMEENKEFFKDSVERMKKIEETVERKVSEQVAKTFQKLDIPTKKDIEELKKRLDLIAKKIQSE